MTGNEQVGYQSKVMYTKQTGAWHTAVFAGGYGLYDGAVLIQNRDLSDGTFLAVGIGDPEGYALSCAPARKRYWFWLAGLLRRSGSFRAVGRLIGGRSAQDAV